MQTCYKIFPRHKDERGRQERQLRSNNEKYQGKKILKTFQEWLKKNSNERSVDESDTETNDEQVVNLALMTNYDEDSDVNM